jgi:hypothetical protein
MSSKTSDDDSPTSSASLARTKRSYTPEDKRAGLLALIVTGSATEAAKQTSIPRKTLETRRRTESELYADLSREYGPQITAQVTAQVTEVVQRYGEFLTAAADRLVGSVNSIDVRDLPNAVKSVQAAQAQAIDKRQLLNGQATDIVVNVDARDLIADIRKMVQPHTVASTAEDA